MRLPFVLSHPPVTPASLIASATNATRQLTIAKSYLPSLCSALHQLAIHRIQFTGIQLQQLLGVISFPTTAAYHNTAEHFRFTRFIRTPHSTTYNTQPIYSSLSISQHREESNQQHNHKKREREELAPIPTQTPDPIHRIRDVLSRNVRYGIRVIK